MAQKLDGRVAFADLLRVLATLALIMAHLAASRMNVIDVSTRSWMVLNLYDALLRWCVPVFVMLSGMFMLDPKHPMPLGKLFFHNALRVLCTLVFWGGVYAIVDHIAAGGRLTLAGFGQALLGALRGNTHYHLWFLYMVLGLYLMTPILRAFVRGASRADLHYFFLACLLFASVLPTAFKLWPNATGVLQVWYDRLNIHLVLAYVGYYVAGYYLKEYTISRLAEALVYVCGVLGAIATAWGTAVLSRSAGYFVDILYSNYAPNMAAFAVAIVVLFRYVLGVSDERSRRQRLSKVARVTFGMYLVHDLFIMLFNFLGLHALTFSPVAAIPILGAVIFLCSFGVAWLIHHIPFVGHWLT